MKFPSLPELSFELPGLPKLPTFTFVTNQRAIDLWCDIKGKVSERHVLFAAIDSAWRDGELSGDDLLALLAHFGFELPSGLRLVHIAGLHQRTLPPPDHRYVIEAVSLCSPLTYNGHDWAALRQVESTEIETDARRIAERRPEVPFSPEETEAEFAKLEELLK